MGNHPSETLSHSFKRLRLSETEQLSQASPSSISPKRKIVLTTNNDLNNSANDAINNSKDGSPVTLCNHIDRSSTNVIPTLQSVVTDIKKGSDEAPLFANNQSSCAQSPITSITKDNENNFIDGELSDEEILRCLRSRIALLDVSDAYVLDCLSHAYSIKKR